MGIYSSNNSFRPPLDKTRCVEAVHEEGRGVGFYQCLRKAIVQRDGHGYCRQHDPAAVAARRKASELRWQERENANDATEREAKRLAALLGVNGRAEYYSHPTSLSKSGYLRNVVISFEDAEKLITRLGKKK